MNQTLTLSLQGAWYSNETGAFESIAAHPALSGSAQVLSDFENAPTGVMSVDARPDFAPAVIEKQLRSEGLIDGEAHVLVHRILAAGGTSRVFYTAVPLAVWQESFTWLERQSDIGLLFSVNSLMLAQAKLHGAVLCRIGRQFRFLVSKPDVLIFLTATAFSDDPDDVDTALLNLLDQARAQWLHRSERTSVLWCDLLTGSQVDHDRLAAIVTRRLTVNASFAPTEKFITESTARCTACSALMPSVSWRSAVNPRVDRIAATLSRFSLPLAGLTAACGVGFVMVAVAWFAQSQQLQSEVAGIHDEVTRVNARIAGMDLKPELLLARNAETLNFLDELTRSTASPDLLDFLSTLKTVSDQRVRILRVRLLNKEGEQGDFRIDGIPMIRVGTEDPLSGFLAALHAKGYSVKAQDPGYQTQQPGFFSYAVHHVGTSAGGQS